MAAHLPFLVFIALVLALFGFLLWLLRKDDSDGTHAKLEDDFRWIDRWFPGP